MDAQWGLFALAVAFGAGALIVPGCLFFRALRLRWLHAVACAPLYSIVAFSLLGIVYPSFGVPASTDTVLGPALLFGAIACVIRLVVERRKRAEASEERRPSGERVRSLLARGAVPAAYIAASLVVAAYALLSAQGSPDTALLSFDNVRHYGQIESFANSSAWSVLHTTLYPVGDGAEFSPFDGDSYYPAAWHIVAAMVASAFDTAAPFAANATNIAFACVVYPLGMYALVTALFPNRPDIAIAGVICTSSFTAFPWTMLGVWEVYPYMASLCLLPAILSRFITMFLPLGGGSVVGSVVVIALGVVSFLFTQPSTFFTAALFLAPFCAALVVRWAQDRGPERRTLRVTLSCAGFVLICLALWAIACNLPLMRDVVAWFWEPVADVPNAVARALTLSFAEPMAQIPLALVTGIGIAALVARRNSRWLIVSTVLACFVFVVAASQPDTPFKHAVAGFWYTDYYRIAAFTAVFATPIASVGLHACCKAAVAAGRVIASHVKIAAQTPERRRRITRAISASCAALALAAFLGTNYLHSFKLADGTYIDTPFSRIEGMARAHADSRSEGPYDLEKQAFVSEVERTIPEGALVVNLPYDGSMFAYSIGGLNVYQRYISGYGPDGDRRESAVIRQKLNCIATDDEARAAMNRIGAEYVLVLDRSRSSMHRWFYPYHCPDWIGMLELNDNTPGFEVILSEGDMRLYRVVG